MRVVVVTGTGTGVGKTVVTAAIAAVAQAAGTSVAVVKPAQTGVLPGEPGDVDDVRRLSGIPEGRELARYPDPVAPATAARLSGLPAVDLRSVAENVAELAQEHDLVIVEGAGGLLVRFDPAGATIADLASGLRAPVLVVTRADLGTLNHTALTIEALTTRGLTLAGVVIGEWPADPDLACRTNLLDLTDLTGAPVSGALAAGAGTLSRDAFLDVARAGLGPALGGDFDPDSFAREHRPHHPHPEDHL
jgi:dethiobiotin synthetase